MVSQNIPQQNLQSMHELTPRDDNKKIVSEVLKHVDQLIRKGELDCAQREIIKAKELDPRNAYAFALEERISALKTEFECTKIETECTEDIKRLEREEDLKIMNLLIIKTILTLIISFSNSQKKLRPGFTSPPASARRLE